MTDHQNRKRWAINQKHLARAAFARQQQLDDLRQMYARINLSIVMRCLMSTR